MMIDSDAVKEFLTFGFPLDLKSADAAAESIIEACSEPDEVLEELASPAEVLESVLEERLAQEDSDTKIVLLLTGGWDSRGILGACLNLLPRDRLLAVTVGYSDVKDVRNAQTVSESMGVEHYRIDPDDIQWSVDGLVSMAEKVYSERKTFGDASWWGVLAFIEEKIRGFCGENYLILSGFNGGSLTGTYSHNDSFDRFFRSQTTGFEDLVERSDVVSYLRPYFEKYSACLNGIDPGYFYDYCFRQQLRIRGALEAPLNNVFSPYDHPRLIRFWMNVDKEKREGRFFYKEALRDAYPGVFFLAKDFPEEQEGFGVRKRRKRNRKNPPDSKAKCNALSFG